MVCIATGSAHAGIDFQADSAQVLITPADGGTDSAADTVETKQSMNFVGSAVAKNDRVNIVSDGSVYHVHAICGDAGEFTVSDSGLT